jgi:hypothetical protein
MDAIQPAPAGYHEFETIEPRRIPLSLLHRAILRPVRRGAHPSAGPAYADLSAGLSRRCRQAAGQKLFRPAALAFATDRLTDGTRRLQGVGSRYGSRAPGRHDEHTRGPAGWRGSVRGRTAYRAARGRAGHPGHPLPIERRVQNATASCRSGSRLPCPAMPAPGRNDQAALPNQNDVFLSRNSS